VARRLKTEVPHSIASIPRVGAAEKADLRPNHTPFSMQQPFQGALKGPTAKGNSRLRGREGPYSGRGPYIHLSNPAARHPAVWGL